MIKYALEQKWPRETNWSREEFHIYKNLKTLRKELKEIKGYDIYENRVVKYRIIQITEKIIK